MRRKDVIEAYEAARIDAMWMPTVRLRWQTRRMERHRDRLDQPSLARLKAYTIELQARSVR